LFQDELMRHLWEIFRTKKGSLITEYIQTLSGKDSEDMRTASSVLLRDINAIEQDLNIQLLP